MSRARPHSARRGWLAFGIAARRALLPAVGAFVLLLTAGTAVGTFSGVDVANAAVERAKSFIELIKQRSPGKRTEAHLAQTKHKRIARLHQRALPKMRTPPIPPLGALPPALIDIVAPPPPLITASFQPLPVLPLFATVAPGGLASPPGVPTSPGSPLIAPPETPTATPQPPPVTTPVSGVPEPATWATMLLGFALIGRELRRRRTKSAKGAQPA